MTDDDLEDVTRVRMALATLRAYQLQTGKLGDYNADLAQAAFERIVSRLPAAEPDEIHIPTFLRRIAET